MRIGCSLNRSYGLLEEFFQGLRFSDCLAYSYVIIMTDHEKSLNDESLHEVQENLRGIDLDQEDCDYFPNNRVNVSYLLV